ncbi:MAG: phosphate ABC transporter substrate-binding protein PstS [bacterium]|jgi:phosphate transport system substrate-binding protein|nr:phosphate ABC transporter substrate-binding protein PstS [bacterium]
MKIRLLWFFVLVFTSLGSVLHADTINGAGASFPFPIYSKWAFDYEKIAGVKINYQSIGSGGGIAQIKAKTVHFGASDEPLQAEELNQAGLIQFPMVVGGVVPVVNLKGIANLKLTRDLLAGIFLGTITQWNDPAIAAVNPGVTFPNRKITVVHRSDGSGTTWIFTNYLAKISKPWAEQVSYGKAVKWPVGVGGKGNEGVALNVKRIPGAIGYVEFAYALTNKLTTVALENQQGKFVEPTIESFQAACANADWAHTPGYYMVLTDQPGEGSWPITGASYILVYKNQDDSAQALQILKFFDWCYKNGGKSAVALHYVPLPDSVISLIRTTWKEDIQAGGEPVWK